MGIIPTLVIEPKDIKPFVEEFRAHLKEKRELMVTGMRVVERANGFQLHVDTMPIEPEKLDT